jgi:hypothetical protein
VGNSCNFGPYDCSGKRRGESDMASAYHGAPASRPGKRADESVAVEIGSQRQYLGRAWPPLCRLSYADGGAGFYLVPAPWLCLARPPSEPTGLDRRAHGRAGARRRRAHHGPPQGYRGPSCGRRRRGIARGAVVRCREGPIQPESVARPLHRDVARNSLRCAKVRQTIAESRAPALATSLWPSI